MLIGSVPNCTHGVVRGHIDLISVNCVISSSMEKYYFHSGLSRVNSPSAVILAIIQSN